MKLFIALIIALGPAACSLNLPNNGQGYTGRLFGSLVQSITSGDDAAHTHEVLPDGKILVGGIAKSSSGQLDFFLAKFTASGPLDPSFGNGGTIVTPVSGSQDRILDMRILPNGRVLVVGGTTTSGNVDTCVARYLPDGRLDTAFAQGGIFIHSFHAGDDYAVAVTVGEAGEFWLGGRSGPQGYVAKFTAGGSLDEAFGSQGVYTFSVGTRSIVNSIQTDSAGRIVTGGTAQQSGIEKVFIGRLSAAGALDTTFGTSGTNLYVPAQTDGAFGKKLLLQSDGKLLIAGWVEEAAVLKSLVARFDADGKNPDSGFGQGGIVKGLSGTVFNALRVLGDGSIYLAGAINNPTTKQDFLLERLTSSGGYDTTFGGGTGRVTTAVGPEENIIYSLQVQADGKPVAVGASRTPETNLDVAIARYETNGNPDPTFGQP